MMFQYLRKTNKTTKDCWEYVGTRDKRGYGRLTIGSRKDGTRKEGQLLHREIYASVFGDFDRKLCVLHKCDNPPCINPDHLFLGTQQDNIKDMVSKNRHSKLKGEKNPRARLTEKNVRTIRYLLSKGIYQKELAMRFGVNQTLISAIKTGKVWL